MPMNPNPKPTRPSAVKKAGAETVSAKDTVSQTMADSLLSKIESEMTNFPVAAAQKVFDMQHKILFAAYKSAVDAGFSETQAMELAERRMEKMLAGKA